MLRMLTVRDHDCALGAVPPLITTTMAVHRVRELVLYRSKGLIRLYIRETRRPKGAKNFPYKGHYKNALHHKNAPPCCRKSETRGGILMWNTPDRLSLRRPESFDG